MLTSKICKNCQLEKDITLFNKSVRHNRNNIIEYSSICKDCLRIKRQENSSAKKKYDQNYAIKNKNKIIERGKLYRNNNKEKIKKKKETYYLNNKENIQLKAAQKYLTNIEFRENKIAKEKDRYANNKDAIKSKVKKYRDINKISINEKISFKRKHDPFIKLKHTISVYCRRELKKNNSSKNNESVVNYLNYTIKDLKEHLEKQFESWMNWNNHGKYNLKTWDDNDSSTWTWQIDHIIPQSDLPYTPMEDDNFKKCWALDNLRPLSSKQNVIDGTSRSRHIIK
jgi:hypothetical protein